MKTTITLTIDEDALEAWLFDVYGKPSGRPSTQDPTKRKHGDEPPPLREHVAQHLNAFVDDELNVALWHDFSHKQLPVITRVEVEVDGEKVSDLDWSVWQ